MTIQTSIQKSKFSAKKTIRYPNRGTLMSYHMQAIEPKDADINEAFPDYHPMWLIQSQEKTVSAQNFKMMRELMLKITRKQCAAYLRVSENSVCNWERGKSSVPFIAFELMRLVFESVNFKLSHKHWQGWFVHNDGRLVSTDTKNLSFMPHELVYARQVHQQKSFYETEYKKLKNELAPLHAEIAALKAADQHNGLLDELKAIESRLAEISSKVSPNKVVQINNKTKITKTLLEVKAA
jgi:DNA-binding XRE family transcriptional regulator